MTYKTLEARPLSGALGAEIYGANLKDHGNTTMWDELQRALLEFKVIAVRGQSLSPAEQRDAAKHFGEPSFYPFAQGLDDIPQMTQVIKEPHDRRNFGNGWHSDTPYLAQPPAITTLYAVETPPKGGDTLYANTQMAYEELSAGMRQMIDGMTGVFSASLKYRPGGNRIEHHAKITSMPVTNTENADRYESRHRIVRTHPQTGDKALYCSLTHTLHFENMSERESQPIIKMLCEHATIPEFTCRVRWEPGQMTFWDNRCTMHNAVNDYHGSRREMRRLTVRPEKPV
jgi:taurine dioxygenase